MKYYRRLELYRRVQVFALGMLLGYEFSGYILAQGAGLSNSDIIGGLGIEMIGAVFTAIAVAYIDTSFTMAFTRKFGDENLDAVRALQAEVQRLQQHTRLLASQEDVIRLQKTIEQLGVMQQRQQAAQREILHSLNRYR